MKERIRTRVRVKLAAKTSVEIEVWAPEDEDPTDLTESEIDQAVTIANRYRSVDWIVEHVEEIKS